MLSHKVKIKVIQCYGLKACFSNTSFVVTLLPHPNPFVIVSGRGAFQKELGLDKVIRVEIS